MREQPRLLSSGAISGCGSARFSCPSPGTPPGHGWEQIPPLGTAEQPDLQKVLKSKILPKKQNDAVREPKNPAAAPRAGGITVPCPRQVASPHCAPGRWHHHAMPQAGGITTLCPGRVASPRRVPGGWRHRTIPRVGGITAPCRRLTPALQAARTACWCKNLHKSTLQKHSFLRDRVMLQGKVVFRG